MADKNQLKIADPVDLADDDPFAELTRIMGFDPRQPARPSAPAAETAGPAELAAEDDFSLDLEKELLGGFDIEQEHLSFESEPAEEQAAAEAQFTAETAEPELPEVDFEFSSAFDEAMTAPGVQEPADRPALEASASEAPDVDFDFASDFDAAMAAPEALEVPAAAEPETDFEGDLDAAFAAIAAEGESTDGDAFREVDFDLGLADEDVRALDEIPSPPALPVTPEAVARDAEIDSGLDAAMADLDFTADADESTSASVEVASAEEVPTAASAEEDLHLFDDIDFHLEDEPAALAEPVPAAETQPEIDESAFGLGEDELRLDDVFAAEKPAEPEDEPAADELAADGQQSADEFVFDDADFADDLDTIEPARDEVAVAAEAPVEEPPAVDETSPARVSDPLSASTFEFSVPPYVPRKLPTSPMDVAAEEYRQREAAAAPAEPQFNLEDELNALLGNFKAGTATAEQPAPAASAPAIEPQQQPAPAPAAYPTSSIFESASDESYPQPSHVEPEPVGFDAPEHPADIEDDLNWELDEAFSEAEAPAPAYEEPAGSYADEAVGGPFEDHRFEAFGQEEPEAAYAESFASEEDEPPMEFDEILDELTVQPQSPAPSYRDALTGVAAGAAAGFASRTFAVDSAPRAAASPSAAASGPVPDRFSPHRDPVVRGDPMKEDPLDIITQLAEKYSRKEPETPYGRAMSIAKGTAPAYHEAPQDEVDGDIDISDAFEEPPEVETIEVGDQAIALADDLDIPELPEEEDLPPAAAYDDLDTEFSSLLSDMNAEPQDPEPGNGHGDRLAGDFAARPYESQYVSASYGAAPARAGSHRGEPAQDSFAFDAAELPGSRMSSQADYAVEDYQYDPEIDQEIAPSHLAAEGRKPVSRGLLIAGVIGGVALVGAIGGLVLSFGGGSDDAPAIVRAGEDPVKVRPETPGGATVPNQDSKVYETVAGEGTAEGPQQEKLVTTTEEPIDVTPPAAEGDDVATAIGKSEDRIEQILEEAENQTDAEIVAVAPRKVRTMVVKPDGTLVPRDDEPETAAVSGDPTEAVAAATPSAAPAPAIPESTGALPETIEENPPALAPAPEEPQAAAAVPPPTEETAATPPEAEAATPDAESDTAISMPDTVPIAPMRPADQPVDVVGEVKPDQVAAAAATAAAGGGWAMQIASQPSEAAAQSSYQDLARRYGGVLQGRDVNIVKAEIPGKGTFWRVRVPAESRNEAISLCENYKAAGGNCFVSR